MLAYLIGTYYIFVLWSVPCFEYDIPSW